MAIPIPDDVRELLQAPNYVHLPTLRADGSPRNWVVWAGLEDHRILALPVRPGRTSARCRAGYAWRKRWRRLGSGPQARHLGPWAVRRQVAQAPPLSPFSTLFVGMGVRPPAATGAQLGEPGDAPADHGQS